MLEVGDICPDWNFVGPLNEHINISMPPIAGRFSILIVYHSKNSVLESVFLKISDKRSLLDSLGVRSFLSNNNEPSKIFKFTSWPWSSAKF